ncbi:hypothetical protein JMG10_40380 [Nostoc ellipsosporum NOK]|nr:hypothetical protein [Nostoc ellipsosporum NOK]
MQFQENQTTKTENYLTLAEKELDEMKTTETAESEPITQVQKDSIITAGDLPDPRFIGFAVVILTAFLFVAAIYYGIINP